VFAGDLPVGVVWAVTRPIGILSDDLIKPVS